MTATCAAIITLAFLTASAGTGPAAAQTPDTADTVVVTSGRLPLHGLLWTPRGRGPFPAVLFNHGSYGRTDTIASRDPEALGRAFVQRGYVFLFLFRRGVGLSADQGASDGELMARAEATRGPAGRNEVQLELLESEDLEEGLAGLAALRALARVDQRRIAVLGHSFGGSLAVFLVARDTALRAAVVFGAAARSWALSSELRTRLRAAIRHTAPIFFIHAANDYSTAPGKALSAELHHLGRPYRLKIYPAFGRTSRDGHNFVYHGVARWQADVFKFLEAWMRL